MENFLHADPAGNDSLLDGVTDDRFEHQAVWLDPVGQRIADDILDEVTAYGPIQPLLDDPTVNEVMVNGPRHVYVERFESRAGVSGR